mmetsp:Transcript_40545/g.126809  ORF Transcript_40545/g.126809 Transcript_40545/m.126809 type:complete len:239 (+) Transcript_40545:228-944(+)
MLTQKSLCASSMPSISLTFVAPLRKIPDAFSPACKSVFTRRLSTRAFCLRTVARTLRMTRCCSASFFLVSTGFTATMSFRVLGAGPSRSASTLRCTGGSLSGALLPQGVPYIRRFAQHPPLPFRYPLVHPARRNLARRAAVRTPGGDGWRLRGDLHFRDQEMKSTAAEEHRLPTETHGGLHSAVDGRALTPAPPLLLMKLSDLEGVRQAPQLFLGLRRGHRRRPGDLAEGAQRGERLH